MTDKVRILLGCFVANVLAVICGLFVSNWIWVDTKVPSIDRFSFSLFFLGVAIAIVAKWRLHSILSRDGSYWKNRKRLWHFVRENWREAGLPFLSGWLGVCLMFEGMLILSFAHL